MEGCVGRGCWDEGRGGESKEREERQLLVRALGGGWGWVAKRCVSWGRQTSCSLWC